MKKIISIIILIIVSSMAFGSLKEDYQSFLDKQSLKLEGENIRDTAQNIDNWLEKQTTYKYYYYPRGKYLFWKRFVGDCSDKALMKHNLLNSLNITNRIVYGRMNESEPYSKLFHVWVEYQINESWISYEYQYFNYLKRVEIGLI